MTWESAPRPRRANPTTTTDQATSVTQARAAATIWPGINAASADGMTCPDCAAVVTHEGVEHDADCPKALAIQHMHQADAAFLSGHNGPGVALRPFSDGDAASAWPGYVDHPAHDLVVLLSPLSPGVRARRIVTRTDLHQTLHDLGLRVSRSRVRRMLAALDDDKAVA
jgi:hypothetical protein